MHIARNFDHSIRVWRSFLSMARISDRNSARWNVAIISKGNTEFGNKIVFMPYQPLADIFKRWSESNSVLLLQAKLDEYRGHPGKAV